MAIDTPQKRFSMMRLASSRAMLVPPSGSITQADRQQLLRHYSGIAWTAPSSSPFTTAPFSAIAWVNVFSHEGYADTYKTAIGHVDTYTSTGGI